MVPDAAIELSSMISREIVSACGVSPTLFDPKSSAAMREAWRQLLFGTVVPLGRIVEAELSAKLFPRINRMARAQGVRSPGESALRGLPGKSRRGHRPGNGDRRAGDMSKKNPVKGGRSKRKALTLAVCKNHLKGPDLKHRYFQKPLTRTLTAGSCAICADEANPGWLPSVWV